MSWIITRRASALIFIKAVLQLEIDNWVEEVCKV